MTPPNPSDPLPIFRECLASRSTSAPALSPAPPAGPSPGDALLLLGSLDPAPDPDAAHRLRLALLGLEATGDLTSFRTCGAPEDPTLAQALADLCLAPAPAPGDADAASPTVPRGAIIDLSHLDPEPSLSDLLVGGGVPRALITCAPNHATKVLERARLMEVAGLGLGRLEGDRLVVRTRDAEFAAPWSELLPPPAPRD